MTIEGYRPLQARLDAIGSTKELMRRVGLETVRGAKLKVARKTGTTGRTIRLTRVTDDSATVTVGGAGAFLERGTKPHIIRARNGKALFFPSQRALVERLGVGQSRKRKFVENRLTFTKGGNLSAGSKRRFGNAAYVHAAVVHHPGTKPQPFLIPAAKEAAEAAGIIDVVERWNEAA